MTEPMSERAQPSLPTETELYKRFPESIFLWKNSNLDIFFQSMKDSIKVDEWSVSGSAFQQANVGKAEKKTSFELLATNIDDLVSLIVNLNTVKRGDLISQFSHLLEQDVTNKIARLKSGADVLERIIKALAEPQNPSYERALKLLYDRVGEGANLAELKRTEVRELLESLQKLLEHVRILIEKLAQYGVSLDTSQFNLQRILTLYESEVAKIQHMLA